MADAYQVLAEKERVIKALSTALDRAYSVLEDIQFVDDLEEATLLAEDVCEEITSSLVNDSISKDLIPGATI